VHPTQEMEAIPVLGNGDAVKETNTLHRLGNVSDLLGVCSAQSGGDPDTVEWNLHHLHCGAFWGGNHDLDASLLVVLT